MAAELEEQRASIEARLAELEEARLFSGEYDARRRRRDRQRRRRRHRLAGLGRDAAAHGDALGRAARFDSARDWSEASEAERRQAPAAGPQWGGGANTTSHAPAEHLGWPRARRQRRDRGRGGRRRAGGRGRGRPDGRRGRRVAAGGGDAPARGEREDRPQRPVLVRLRQEVQEVPWRLVDVNGLRGQLKLLADSL